MDPLTAPSSWANSHSMKMDQLREQRRLLETQLRDLEKREEEQVQTRDALERLEVFCDRVAEGLDNLTFEENQQLLRLVVERVTYQDYKVRIDAVIPMDTGAGTGAVRTLPAGLPSVRFEFGYPRFGAGVIEYRSRLRGLDEEWSDWSETNSVVLRDLWERDYRFEVQGRDGSGQVSGIAGFAFRVTPPWYRTT